MLLIPLSQSLTYAFDDHGVQVNVFYSMYITAAVVMQFSLLAYQTSLFNYRFNKLMWATLPMSAFVVFSNWAPLPELLGPHWMPQFPETTLASIRVYAARINVGIQMLLVLWLSGRALWDRKPGSVSVAIGLSAMMLVGLHYFIDLREYPVFSHWSWVAPMALGWVYRFSMISGSIFAYQKSERGVQQLSHRVIGAHIEERRRVARELHDGIAQSLHALRIHAKQAASQLSGPQAEQVDSVASGISEAVDELRVVANDLNPGFLMTQTLEGALGWYAGQLHARTGMKIEIEVAGQADAPEALKQHLYRIAQESLSNAARHGAARHAWVRLSVQGKVWELVVEDDGKGMASADPGSVAGQGLRNIQDRAELLGGQVWIAECKPRGVRLRVSLPQVPGHRIRNT